MFSFWCRRGPTATSEARYDAILGNRPDRFRVETFQNESDTKTQNAFWLTPDIRLLPRRPAARTPSRSLWPRIAAAITRHLVLDRNPLNTGPRAPRPGQFSVPRPVQPWRRGVDVADETKTTTSSSTSSSSSSSSAETPPDPPKRRRRRRLRWPSSARGKPAARQRGRDEGGVSGGRQGGGNKRWVKKGPLGFDFFVFFASWGVLVATAGSASKFWPKRTPGWVQRSTSYSRTQTPSRRERNCDQCFFLVLHFSASWGPRRAPGPSNNYS